MQIWMLTAVLLALITTIPLAWKWQLGMLRASIVVIAFGAGSSIATEVARRVFALPPSVCASAVWLLTVGSASGLLAFRFYRDPERRAPDRDDVIVSPADGLVIYVRESHEGTLPVSDKHGRR